MELYLRQATGSAHPGKTTANIVYHPQLAIAEVLPHINWDRGPAYEPAGDTAHLQERRIEDNIVLTRIKVGHIGDVDRSYEVCARGYLSWGAYAHRGPTQGLHNAREE